MICLSPLLEQRPSFSLCSGFSLCHSTSALLTVVLVPFVGGTHKLPKEGTQCGGLFITICVVLSHQAPRRTSWENLVELNVHGLAIYGQAISTAF
jgi:hypothetical protein